MSKILMYNSNNSYESPPHSLDENEDFYDNDDLVNLPSLEDVQIMFVDMTKQKHTRQNALSSLIDCVLLLVKEGCKVDLENNNLNGNELSNSPCRTAYRNRSPSPQSNILSRNSPSPTRTISRSSSFDESVASVDLESFGEPNQVLRYILGAMLRLSMWCPFKDVRDGCAQALKHFETQDIDIPKVPYQQPSHFIPYDHIRPVDTDDELTHNLYVTSYVQTCRLEHYVLIMGMHPEYLQEFLQANNELLMQGSLSSTHKRYIGIMAAAQHKCNYLVRLMEEDFVTHGGDKNWLTGIQYADPKLAALSEINKVLAHRPWLINSSHIQELCDRKGDWKWSLAELLESIILLCHFHCLAIFCLGTGTNLEIDHIQSSQKRVDEARLSNRRSRKSSRDFSEDVETLMEKMLQLEEEDVTKEELNLRFEKQKNEATEISLDNLNSHSSTKYSQRYVTDQEFCYQDFFTRGEEIPTFKAIDYNWDDHAYSLITQLTGSNDLVDLLDRKMKIAYNLTYHTLATKKDVDTTDLRRAIWMYIHVLCGVMYDDFDYNKMNKLIELPLKIFIKSATCCPSSTKKLTYDGFWKQFSHSEKVHVMIMLLEGRNQLELLYGLRAVTEYMKER